MKSVNKKMLDLLDILKERKIIRFDNDFCKVAGMSKSYLIPIRKGDKNFTISHVKNICTHFKVNANWIFGIQDKIFLE